jgi:hypothetical protein
VAESLLDLVRWFYRQLQAGYDHLTSEVAIAKQYTRTEAGRRSG